MTSLGEILLRFGATGATGEEPLRFRTAHINLLVGPNNAGKSLMLRETSGVNPRGRQRSAWESEKYGETRIVEAVDWSEDGAQALKEEIIALVFANEPAWDLLKTRAWDQLLPALDQAVEEFVVVRDQLCAALIELFSPLVGDWQEVVTAFAQQETKDLAPLVIGGAFLALQLTYGPSSVSEAEVSGVDGAVAPRSAGPLTPEQAEKSLQLLEASWTRCEAIFTRLGVDTADISVAQLLNLNAFGGALLTELAKHPIFRMILARSPELLSHATPTATALEQVARFAAVGAWFLDPAPLAELAGQLRGAYEQETWVNHARRAQLAKAALYLDGVARLNVTRSAELAKYSDDDGEQPPILALLKRPDLRELLRTLTKDALGGHVVLDMTTKAPKVIWRLSQDEPPEGLETSYSEAAEAFHGKAVRLDERSDGIHAFVGMLAAILAKSSDLVFIDEPEAFLHPPLVRQFARQISWLARQWDAQFFIATHSADLLETCVASGAEVNIIRLTHDRDRSTARLLNSADLRHLARDPLLRSEATLSALFHVGAVICEAAGDRVLYKEINERLLGSDDEALDSCVFLNAQNWNTIPRMMAPLRRMGVAAAAIVDADVLFEGGLTLLLDAAQVDKVIRDGWLKQRDGLRDKLLKRLGPAAAPAGDDPEKKLQLKGKIITGLKTAEKKIFAELRTSMAKYGVFIVPVGELEDWLAPLGLKPPAQKDRKARWLQDALARLGQDPQLDSYVRPDKGDIWEFMRGVVAWILDPEREGTSPATHPVD